MQRVAAASQNRQTRVHSQFSLLQRPPNQFLAVGTGLDTCGAIKGELDVKTEHRRGAGLNEVWGPASGCWQVRFW